MNKIIQIWIVILFFAGHAWGHFGMIIPSDNIVLQDEQRSINLQISFSHPMELSGMKLLKPKVFNLVTAGKKYNLRQQLKPIRVMAQPAWNLNYQIKRPGTYIFYMEPQPYWEPAEDMFIIHYTKTVVTAFGDDENWDQELGLPTEIVPLSKPFGLYAGNVFQGIVKLNGKSVPYARVEVEYYNQDHRVQAPNVYMVTQTIKTDKNGVFTYAAPKSGWWGFAALHKADFKLKTSSDEKKEVELGAVIWVYFENWQQKQN